MLKDSDVMLKNLPQDRLLDQQRSWELLNEESWAVRWRKAEGNIIDASAEKLKESVSLNISKLGRIQKEYGITRELLEQQFGKKLVDAANNLGIARSTLKRICRVYKIYRWPRLKSRKENCSFSQSTKSLQDVDRQPVVSGATDQPCSSLSLGRGLKSLTNSEELAVPMQSESVMSIKVNYGNKTVRFPLSFSSGKKDLEEEVEKRLKIPAEESVILYEDEDNDRILITCDSDLHYAMHTLKSLDRTVMRMLVQIEP